jgi:3-dehydroquinate synthase
VFVARRPRSDRRESFGGHAVAVPVPSYPLSFAPYLSLMPPITVRHSLGSYPVHVEPGLLRSLHDLVTQALPGRKLVLITDDMVDLHFEEWARKGDIRLKPDLKLTFLAGEASKTRGTWATLTDRMLAAGFGRDSAVIALGGGVVGDLAGFVAATYLRGIPFVQVPTTLLAMLDASVGGKVGVDTPQGKNLIGAFHPPVLVAADPHTLLSLPERDYRGGMAEAVKHGLIADAEYFAWIESHAAELAARDIAALTHLVRRSVEIKAEVVEGDEREEGRRAILNVGHTIAHAIEQVSGYAVPHGEAVAIGMVAECRIAEATAGLATGSADRVAALLTRLGLPTRLTHPLPITGLLDAMQHDKKNRAGVIRLALPAAIGAMHAGDGRWTLATDSDRILAVLG